MSNCWYCNKTNDRVPIGKYTYHGKKMENVYRKPSLYVFVVVL